MQKNFEWSPDGTKAIFLVTDYVNKSEKMYMADAEGSNIKQLASDANESFFGSVSWSHNGKRITFSGRNIWVMNSNETNLRQLGSCWGGSWSPDDSTLLCTSSEEVNDDQFIRHLYLINADSGNKTEIIKSIEVENPAWSPGGRNILFISFIEKSNPGIFVSHLQGRNVNLIYGDNNPLEKAAFEAVSWSPDGSKIAFIVPGNDNKLYTINPDGTDKTLLTSNLSWSWSNPYAWSPSGDKIAFSSSIANGEHIFIANPDGTELVQITTGENKHYVLGGTGGSWSPDGSRLLIGFQNGKTSRSDILLIATPRITESIIITPKAPGFGATLATGILYTIYLFKRRYN